MRKMLVVMMAVVAVAFVGCTKEEKSGNNNAIDSITEQPTPEPNPQPTSVEWVDLGLPSGLLWATCNVGANAPEEYGDCFAWGETQTKSEYNWSTYAYGSANNQLTKYCYNSEYGLDGFTDSLTILEPLDDAASVNWGNGARIPTKEDWQELINNTNAEWTTEKGVNGRRFTAPNGRSFFLPANGTADTYWSASLDTYYPYRAWSFYFLSDRQLLIWDYMRSAGLPVRAVRAIQN